VKRAGRAVELRPAPKARNAAHPQERQHSAAGGGTRDRVRPDGALSVRRQPPRQGSLPEWAETRPRYAGQLNDFAERLRARAPRARPERATPRPSSWRHTRGTWVERSSGLSRDFLFPTVPFAPEISRSVSFHGSAR
jgi:hypothetical protein